MSELENYEKLVSLRRRRATAVEDMQKIARAIRKGGHFTEDEYIVMLRGCDKLLGQIDLKIDNILRNAPVCDWVLLATQQVAPFVAECSISEDEIPF